MVELPRAGVHATQVVVAEDRRRILRDQRLERRDGAVRVPALSLQSAEEEVSLLAVRIEGEHALIGRDRLVVAVEGLLDAGLQLDRVDVVGLGRHHVLHLIERGLELAGPDLERGETEPQHRGDRIGGYGTLEFVLRDLDVTVGQGHLPAQEVPHGLRLGRNLGSATLERIAQHAGAPAAPCTAAQRENHQDQGSGGPREFHEPNPLPP